MDFVKKEWQFRDIISENELNRMEDGIEEGITKAEQAQQTATDAQTNLDNHVSATTGVHGATSAATPNTLVQRDPAGRFKAAAPSASDDVARKAEVDAHATRTDNPHGTTAEQVGAPSLTKTVLDGTSLNTVTTSGFYRLGINHQDAPSEVDYGQMIVSRGGDTILQIVTGFNNNKFYIRHGNPPEVGGQGSWQPWRRLWHDGNDGAGSGLDADLLDGLHASNFWTKSEIPYETGSWTPELRFGGSTAEINYSFRAGRYTRIANVVYWSFTISLNSKGSASGAAEIAGLPFSSAGLNFWHAVGYTSNISVPSGQWLSSHVLGTTIYLITNTFSPLTSAEFSNISSIGASGFYFIS